MACFLLSFLSNSNRKTQKSLVIGISVYVLWKGNEFFPARKTDNDDAFSNVACKVLLLAILSTPSICYTIYSYSTEWIFCKNPPEIVSTNSRSLKKALWSKNNVKTKTKREVIIDKYSFHALFILHWCKMGERRGEIGKTIGCLRIPFIEAEPRTYAGRTPVRGAYWSEKRHCVRHPKPLAAMSTLSEYAGRTRVRGAYLGSDRWLLRIMLPN